MPPSVVPPDCTDGSSVRTSTDKSQSDSFEASFAKALLAKKSTDGEKGIFHIPEYAGWRGDADVEDGTENDNRGASSLKTTVSQKQRCGHFGDSCHAPGQKCQSHSALKLRCRSMRTAKLIQSKVDKLVGHGGEKEREGMEGEGVGGREREGEGGRESFGTMDYEAEFERLRAARRTGRQACVFPAYGKEGEGRVKDKEVVTSVMSVQTYEPPLQKMKPAKRSWLEWMATKRRLKPKVLALKSANQAR